MVRVTNSAASKKRKKKVLKNAKGYRGAKSRRFKTANEQVMHAKDDAFKHRRKKKSDFRKLQVLSKKYVENYHDSVIESDMKILVDRNKKPTKKK